MVPLRVLKYNTHRHRRKIFCTNRSMFLSDVSVDVTVDSEYLFSHDLVLAK